MDTSIRGNACHNDSASQVDEFGLPDCTFQVQPFTLPGRAKKQLTSVLHAEVQDMQQNLGEFLSATLISQLAESSVESFTVAVEGFGQTEALPEEQKLRALQASIALRTRLQGFL